jgi:cation diffusion facilitator family transporter
MAIESVARFWQPHTIQFTEAIYVAIIGLVVNLISALLLQDNHDHSPGHAAKHGQHAQHHHHDHNLRAAYVHVLADTLTSLLAIVALLAGKFLGWVWLDAAMGLVGAGVISKWAYELVRESAPILLDGSIDKHLQLTVTNAIEQDADNRITDLHIWQLSENHLAATISLVTHYPQKPEHYKTLLSHIPNLNHVLVEVNRCPGEPCLPLHPDSHLELIASP